MVEWYLYQLQATSPAATTFGDRRHLDLWGLGVLMFFAWINEATDSLTFRRPRQRPPAGRGSRGRSPFAWLETGRNTKAQSTRLLIFTPATLALPHLTGLLCRWLYTTACSISCACPHRRITMTYEYHDILATVSPLQRFTLPYHG